MGIPNYGYIWPVPFIQGEMKAVSISNFEAVNIAGFFGAEILYNEIAQTPYFMYDNGRDYEVWFEDARSIDAKLRLIPEYGLNGAGVWNVMKYFPQMWLLVNGLFRIRRE